MALRTEGSSEAEPREAEGDGGRRLWQGAAGVQGGYAGGPRHPAFLLHPSPGAAGESCRQFRAELGLVCV